MENAKNQLREDSVEFAILVSDTCDDIKGCSVFVNQLLRSSSSIGANLHEARYAQSRADFVNKLHIALKECAETEYWIEMLVGCNAITSETSHILFQECGIIRRMLAKSVTTAKSNKQQEEQH